MKDLLCMIEYFFANEIYRDTVKTARDIRKWLPKIRKELQYNVEQLEVNRNYSTYKIKEFKERSEYVF